MKTSAINLPLHTGHAPQYLIRRMIRLSHAISKVIVDEYGQQEFLRRSKVIVDECGQQEIVRPAESLIRPYEEKKLQERDYIVSYLNSDNCGWCATGLEDS